MVAINTIGLWRFVRGKSAAETRLLRSGNVPVKAMDMPFDSIVLMPTHT